jgi:hypothetical protein
MPENGEDKETILVVHCCSIILVVQTGDPFKQPVLIGSPISKNYFIKLMRKFMGVLLGPTQLLHNNPSAILIEPSGQRIT